MVGKRELCRSYPRETPEPTRYSSTRTHGVRLSPFATAHRKEDRRHRISKVGMLDPACIPKRALLRTPGVRPIHRLVPERHMDADSEINNVSGPRL